ncbi:MAG: phage portal protein, partial [Pseudomonadota bacterium]
MTILDTLAAWFGYSKAKQAYPQMLLAMADAERWSIPNSDIPQAQAELYQRLSWVAIAVELVSTSCAAQALNVKRLESEKRVDVPNHPFELLLEKPNPLQSRAEFLTATFAYRALCGNAYWHINAPR